MNLVPLVALRVALRRLRLALRAARCRRRPRGDDAARRGGAGAHLRHRHADDGGRARAGDRRDVGDLDVRVAAGARLSLHRDDDRRAGDGRVHPAAARGAAGDSRRSARASRTAPTVLQGPLFGIHVSSLLFAYASFALACVIGITYVLLFKEIKAKHLGFFYARLPSLQVLDRMNQRAIVIGWIFLTIGMIVGAIWAAQARGGYRRGDPRVQAMSLQDPKIFVALLCWAVYSFELFAARRIGWGGRRAAYLSALGFADRAAELRADQLLPDEEPQLLDDDACSSLVGISHRTAPVELRERVDFQARGVAGGAARAGRARLDARSGRAVDLQPRRGLRRLRRCDGDARRIWCASSASSTASIRGELAPHIYDVADLDVGAASVPRRRRPRLAGRRRAADPRPGEGRAHRRRRRADRRPGAQPPVPLVVRRRQARAHGNRPRLGRRVGQLRGGGAGAQDLRRPRRPERRSSSAPARWAS